jgi:hypothetical protein
MAVARAVLARLPAGDGVVAVGEFAENLLDVPLGIPLLLLGEIEGFLERSSGYSV